MRTSPLFWRMYLIYSGLVVLGIISLTSSVAIWQEDELHRQVDLRLRDAALLLRESMGSRLTLEPTAQLQQEVRKLGNLLKMRLTLIADGGEALADSAQESLEDVMAMENQGSRTEVMKAQRDGEGSAQRSSPTLGGAYQYFAISIQQQGKNIGIVRTALPLDEIQVQLNNRRRIVWSTASALGIASLAITYFFTKRLVKPIETLASAAEGIAAGNYSQRIQVNSNDEIGRLARSFERISSELGSRENQLREGAQRQTTVLSGMVEGVIAVDRDLHVLFANVAAGMNLEFEPEKVEGLPLLEVVRSHELREVVRQALASAKSVQDVITWQSRKKNLVLDVQAIPLAGNPSKGVVLVLHDVTELKRLEGLRHQFVANVSHELKTPLSSIKAYTETLLEGAIEDPINARHFLNRIDDQASRLHELILDLLSLARVESGQAALEIADLPLSKIVEACLSDHEQRAEARGLRFVNLASDCPFQVRADEEALLQILGNLIDNAIKYTPAGGSITIRCRKEGREAIIEVSDTGVGISPEHHERLFERFYRVDKARSRELGGTGLGLAIVKHLCQAMKGSVSVQSEPGRGSAFSVKLPLV